MLPTESDFYKVLKRSFQEQLVLVGVDIVCNGVFKPQAAITSTVEDELRAETIGSGVHLDARVDMLADDFDDCNVELNVSEFTVSIFGKDNTMTVVNIHRDPMDPVVHFYGSRDY
jgi:hypothetical protein